MNFTTGLIMGIIVFIIVAYAIIFNVIGRQLDELDCQFAKLDCQLDKLCERINDFEDMIYDKDHEEFYDDDNSEADDGENEDLEEGDD